MLHSSTSSSEGFPWAGIATALLVLLLDLTCLARPWPWVELAHRHLPTKNLLAAGIASDAAELAALGAAPSGVARVALLGTSRLQATLIGTPLAADLGADGSLAVASLAHAGLEPFAIRALADRLAELRVDVAVLHLSEFDSHRAPMARPATSFGSVGAVADLTAAIGPAAAWRSRVWLERMALASLFAAYEHREVVLGFGLERLRAFGAVLGPRAIASAEVGVAGFAAAEERWPGLDVRRRKQVAAELPRHSRRELRDQQDRIHAIVRGPHVDVQERLLAAAVERLREAGTRVVLVEAPLSPTAAEFYDVSTRREFELFARDLASRPGVRFVPLEERFYEEDFVDYAHVTRTGAEKLAPSIATAVRAAVLEHR